MPSGGGFGRFVPNFQNFLHPPRRKRTPFRRPNPQKPAIFEGTCGNLTEILFRANLRLKS
jgi:hypothetical protein